MMDAEERRRFVYDNVVCVWGYNRKNEGPAMTIGYYVMDGDDLCYFTMAKRAKAKVAHRDPRASVCVLDMKMPPSYLLVYGTVKVETDLDYVFNTALKTLKLEMINEGNLASGADVETQRDAMMKWCREEERVVLRLTPTSTFYSPPTRGRNPVEKYEFRRSLGAVEEGTMRIGQALPWR
jgi:hypothetical protein